MFVDTVSLHGGCTCVENCFPLYVCGPACIAADINTSRRNAYSFETISLRFKLMLSICRVPVAVLPCTLRIEGKGLPRFSIFMVRVERSNLELLLAAQKKTKGTLQRDIMEINFDL